MKGNMKGGAWKLAFADLCLSLTALFLVLWLVTLTTQKEEQKVIKSIKGIGKDKNKSLLQSRGASNDPENEDPSLDPVDSEEDTRKLVRASWWIEQVRVSRKAEKNIQVDIQPNGLRILIKDDDHKEMFPVGSTHMNPFFENLLADLTPVINDMDNRITVTGHTDILPYHSGKYNNWNLSAERALEAKAIMKKYGLDEGKILQVAGMADEVLINQKDGKSAENRRIEILVLNRRAEQDLTNMHNAKTKIDLSESKKVSAAVNEDTNKKDDSVKENPSTAVKKEDVTLDKNAKAH